MTTQTEKLRKALIANGFVPFESKSSRDCFVKDFEGKDKKIHKKFVWLLTGTLRRSIDDPRFGNSISAPNLAAWLLEQ